MRVRRFILSVLYACLATATASAAPRSKEQMEQSAARVLASHPGGEGSRAPLRKGKLMTLDATPNYMIMGYESGGFAVLSTDDLAPEVLGYSTSKYSEEGNPAFNCWLESVDSIVSRAVQIQMPLMSVLPDPDKYPSFMEPMLTTEWDQKTPYNNMCPLNSTTSRCLTGCVATAMAQVLNYHRTPSHGYGTRTIYFPFERTDGEAVTANFDQDNYDWDSMLDRYEEGEYTQQQADAVALLMRDCGVASNMKYSGLRFGSGAAMSDAAYGLRTYFGFPDAQELDRIDYSMEEWMDLVYSELYDNGPVIYAGGNINYAHAFVLHGYDNNGLVYVNWGWSGKNDGYYDISLLNPESESGGFAQNQSMICGIKSDRQSRYHTKTVHLEEPGTLKQFIESIDDYLIIGSIAITGSLNKDDLLFLAGLTGSTRSGNAIESQLHSINLQKAVLPGNILPDSIFMGCTGLYRLILPETLEHIGKQALSGCSKIKELRVPTRIVPTLDGLKVFDGILLSTVKLYVRSSMKTKYLNMAQWKNFGSKNIVETGTSLKVKNITRKYGQDNPIFTYILSGDSVRGTPQLACEATASSPAGRYPITISPGTIVNDEVDFIDGYLIIEKINATATIGSYSREQGHPDPEFGIIGYTGLIPADTVPDWLSLPLFTTTATADSAPGEYPITVTGATAQSYNITFIPGVLTVIEPSNVPVIRTDGSQDKPVYNIDGTPAEVIPQRFYIIDGKKYIYSGKR